MVIIESSLNYNNDAIIFNGFKSYETFDDFINELHNYIKCIIGENSIKVVTQKEHNGLITFTTADDEDLQTLLKYVIDVDRNYGVPMYDVAQLLDCFTCVVDDKEGSSSTVWAYWLLDLDIM